MIQHLFLTDIHFLKRNSFLALIKVSYLLWCRKMKTQKWNSTAMNVWSDLNVHKKLYGNRQIPEFGTQTWLLFQFNFIHLLPTNHSGRKGRPSSPLFSQSPFILLLFVPLSLLSQETSHALFALHEQTDCKAADNFFALTMSFTAVTCTAQLCLLY